jgi:hypothetical protein
MDIVERLNSVCEEGADPDLIYDAAAEIERLREFLRTIAFTGMTADDAEEHARIALTPNA